MKGYCAKCEKREKCKTLCAVCEAYVNQDFVTVDEGLIYKYIENKEKEVDYDNIYDKDMPSRILKIRYKYMIIRLYEDGKSFSEIAYHVPLSERQIRRIIATYKKNN